MKNVKYFPSIRRVLLNLQFLSYFIHFFEDKIYTSLQKSMQAFSLGCYKREHTMYVICLTLKFTGYMFHQNQGLIAVSLLTEHASPARSVPALEAGWVAVPHGWSVWPW